jgi:ATP-dependent helicase/DNAse subunit B
MLTSDSARAALAARFGPERTFSATELERYAACPYRFFLDQVLRLEPLEELALAMDYLARGRRAHELLAIFHRRLNQQRGGPASPAEGADDDCQHLLRQTLDELYAQPAAGPMRAALEEIDRRLLTRWIADYRRQHAAYDALWEGFDGPPRPAHFEISFGREVRAESDPASTTQPLELGDKRQQVRLAGSIDRIDLGRVAGQQVFNIVDYKTGGSAPLTADAVARGYALQLPIYALAAEQLLLADRGATGWQAGYWQLKDHGFKARQALRLGARHAGGVGPDAAWEELRRAAVAAVLSLVRGMRGGQFPVFNEDLRCTGYCSFHTVCRIHQIRSLEKTWQPPHPAD